MAQPLLNLSEAPDDSIERLLWLSGVKAAVDRELAGEFQRTYYQARVEQRIEYAIDLDIHPAKRIIAWTRHENEVRGRGIRWGDGY